MTGVLYTNSSWSTSELAQLLQLRGSPPPHRHGDFGRKLQSLLEGSLLQLSGCEPALQALRRAVVLA